MRSIINAVKGYQDEQERVFQDGWYKARYIAAWATNRKFDNKKFPWEIKKPDQSGFDSLRAWAESMNNNG